MLDLLVAQRDSLGWAGGSAGGHQDRDVVADGGVLGARCTVDDHLHRIVTPGGEVDPNPERAGVADRLT